MFDMKQCKPGDKLISKHGLILTYVGPNTDDSSGGLYPHKVQYPDNLTFGGSSFGSRTDEGYVFQHKRLPGDHDIVGFAPQDS